MTARARLAILASHPIQYYAPLFRTLAQALDVHVYYSHHASPEQQAAAGFGTAFDWDLDLLSGYQHSFLNNRAAYPDAQRFRGCDTPEIGARLREGSFDAVLALGWHLKSLLQGTWAAKRLGLPVLVRGDSHLATPRSRAKVLAKRLTYPVFLRTFDAALTVGERNRDYYEHYGYPRQRMFHSPHCVDTSWFRQRATQKSRAHLRSRLGVRPEEKLILFAGKLIEAKRPFDVVRAAEVARARGRAAHVAIAGSGKLEGLLREAASALKVPLHCLGFQNQANMPAVYAAADVLVLPSECETWGLVCNEALACGTPVVVSDAAGCAPDLAADGRAGRSFPVGDCAACAQSLIDLFNDPPDDEELEQVSARYSLMKAAEGITAAMSAVATQRR